LSLKLFERNDMKKIMRFVRSRDFAFYAVFILILLCIRSSVFASYHVPTGSMRPTILEGDFFFTNKLAYRLKVPFTKASVVEWGIPGRGDIIVFKYPGDERSLYTKRVIGRPGDTVEIRDGRIAVNGKEAVLEPLGASGRVSKFREKLSGSEYTIQRLRGRRYMADMEPVTVPEGHIFVVGDNRDNSRDSREWGFVPLGNVEGKLVMRWFSFDRSTLRPRFDRIGPVENTRRVESH
jgi:signal peptidase I